MVLGCLGVKNNKPPLCTPPNIPKNTYAITSTIFTFLLAFIEVISAIILIIVTNICQINQIHVILAWGFITMFCISIYVQYVGVLKWK